ncbi:MAG TPA: 5-carboxymethyl-2-hydroxymuconate Delta-isomerase [Woeseiaceae bacterium]|nr:5-carboxymethyl-2-hydroxymuconate Delta-isomerase [Woeseiaceae bacterium]
MPHLIIEYSANLEADLDIRKLVRAMHETAVTIDALPTAGIRTRAVRRDNVMIADGHPDNGFINMTLRIAQGRTIEEQKAAGEKLFGSLKGFISEVYARRPIALSFEIQEIDTEKRWKHGNIRDYLAKRADRN